MGVIIFSGLPVIGWGINDINGFMQNPFRASYIIIMAVLVILVVIFVPNEGRGYGEGTKPVKRQKRTILFLQVMPVVMLVLSSCFDRYEIAVLNSNDAIRFAGLALTFAGYMFMIWSVMALGR